MGDIDTKGTIEKVPISYSGDPCLYKFLELPNGLKAILICDEKFNIYEHGDNEELSMDMSSINISDEDLASVEGMACLTFAAGSIHDEGYYPGIGDLCRQIIHAYNLEHEVVPTSKTDLGHTTFFHIRSDTELDSYLDSLAQIIRKPNLDLKYLRHFMTNPLKSSQSYFKNTFDDDEFCLTNEVEVFMIYKWHELFQNISPGGGKCLAEYGGAKNDKDIGDLVKKYWQEFYVPKKASLVIKSNATLDVLEKLLIKHFAALENRDEIKPSFSENKLTMATLLPKRHKWMEYQGSKNLVGDEHSLLISWLLPPEYWTEYLVKPHLYLSWALNNQGKKSLVQMLYKQAWITKFWAGCNYSSYHRNELSTLFQIRVKLTDTGLKAKEEVLGCIFTAIRHLVISKDIFEQVKLTTAISFRKFDFHSLPYEYRPSMYLKNLVHISSAISKFPPEHVIIGELIFGDFDLNCAEMIEKFRNLLTPESADFILMSPTPRYPNTVEKYSHTVFFQEDINESILNKCNLPSNFYDFNQWKVTKLDMYNEGTPIYIKPFTAPITKFYFPKKLTIPENDFYEIWHKQCPRAKEMVVIGIHLINPIVKDSPLKEIMAEVMAKFLDECLISEVYDASLANYQCKTEKTDCGMLISVMGPRYAIHSVLVTVLNTYNTLQKLIDKLPFACERIRRSIQASLGEKVQDGTEIVGDIVHSLLIRNYISMQDKYTAATKNPLNIKKLKKFVTNFQKKIYAYFYIQGNFTDNEAQSLVQNDIADKIFTSKDSINPKTAKVKSVLWPVPSSVEFNVVRIDTVEAWARDPICQVHYHCGYATASNIALATINMKLFEEEMERTPYVLHPYRFEPEISIVYGSLFVYFSIFLDSPVESQNISALSSRSKFITNLDRIFLSWYELFLKRLTDSTILKFIYICKNDLHNYMNNLLLKEEVANFLEKVKSLDFNFSTLVDEETCFTKFETELQTKKKDSVRSWVKELLLRETRNIFIFLEKSERPLLFKYTKKNPYDLIIFEEEETRNPAPNNHQYIDNFQVFKERLPSVNRDDTLEENEELEDDDDEEMDQDFDTKLI